MIHYWKTCIILFLLTATSILSQAQPKITEAHLEAIAKFGFLEGNWHGSGWMMVQGGKQVLFEQREKVQWKLDKSVLLIEGKGESEGEIIHNAMAVLSYDPENTAYSFRSYLANGLSGEYQVELTSDQQMVWHLEFPGRTIRYTVTINEKGQWYEIGEFKTGEDSWYKFFEMTLDKI